MAQSDSGSILTYRRQNVKCGQQCRARCNQPSPKAYLGPALRDIGVHLTATPDPEASRRQSGFLPRGWRYEITLADIGRRSS